MVQTSGTHASTGDGIERNGFKTYFGIDLIDFGDNLIWELRLISSLSASAARSMKEASLSTQEWLENKVKIKSSISEVALFERPTVKVSSDNVRRQFNMKVWNSKREIWTVALNTMFVLRTSTLLILSSPSCRGEIQTQACRTKCTKLLHCCVLKWEVKPCHGHWEGNKELCWGSDLGFEGCMEVVKRDGDAEGLFR